MKDNQFMLVLFKEKEEVNVKIVLLNVSPTIVEVEIQNYD